MRRSIAFGSDPARRDAAALPDPSRRLALLLVGAATASVALGLRLYDWHVRQAVELVRQGSAALLGRTEITPRRGTIYDRTGDVLALTRRAYAVGARPAEIVEAQAVFSVANRLGGLLGLSPALLAQRIGDPKQTYAKVLGHVNPKVGDAVAAAIKAGELPGIELAPDHTRLYPNQGLAAHALGFMAESPESNGLSVGRAGVEAYYDRDLGGKSGLVRSDRDRHGRRIPVGRYELVPPKHGSHLVLSIDRTIQHIAEQELDFAINRFSAEKGNVILTNPFSGEILAMANRPTYVPGLVATYPNVGPEFENRVTHHDYEPGSTFKLITMAAGLDAGAITPETTHNLPGEYEAYGQEFRNWDGVTYPNQNMVDVLLHSSNIGAIFVADRVGANRFYDYVAKFGFGALTGVDLTGELSGIVRRRGDRGWFLPDLAANSFGQGISCTPLQLAMAVGAIANGGLMLRPRMARAIIDPDGRRTTFEPETVRRVISGATAATLTRMMTLAEAGADDNLALLPGYRTAGKTDTAEIPLGGKFQPDVTNASYVGFGPLELPTVLCLVTIEKPQVAIFGSQVASPTFRRIMERVFGYLKTPAQKPDA
ncbi:MAG: penicillin-binding protein 2 [Actinobacteria bacterium]|nr:penicillin-binding protein 2 [Actinomycetota bacterium]